MDEAGPGQAVEPATAPVALREPAHQVSPRAISYWRLRASVRGVVETSVAAAAWWWIPERTGIERPWWSTGILLLVAGLAISRLVVMPLVRFRIHRWEVTPVAVFTRSGWLARTQRIAPLSRVQTVDSAQGALMRWFGLASITVTTASAAGPITIDCLDEQVARRTVAELTEVTARTAGDAT